ncbi:hypothetical protein R3P38DRAFT_3573267 [Favolaschia claudopus]|uniref:Uncharacterized protein n=1 Tax=Favolaschia claudopus TaxID=2862362 RepID=A0AAW0APD4_9AGAR
MGSEELSTLFIKLPPPGHGSSAPVQPRSGPIILNEQQLQNLKVTEINASLATFRACLLESWDGGHTSPTPPAAQAEIDEWVKHESEARNFLTQRLEDAMFLQADLQPTVALMWEYISNKVTALSAHVVASRQADFDNCNCGDKDDLRHHLEINLRTKYMNLITLGVTMTDSQYATRIINSLPRHYQSYLSTDEPTERCGAEGSESASGLEQSS